jgi:predicted  nucleic acid-binding Zn-ribbon protein
MKGRDSKRWEKLRAEYDELKQERSRIREEITEFDNRLTRKEISDRERDKKFRIKLSRAGEISRRIVEVAGEMAKIGKLPGEYQD